MSRPPSSRPDPARRAAYRVLRRVTGEAAYANLALAHEAAGLSPRDAAFATELTFGACRALGTYDAILQAVSKRPLTELDPPVLDVLRLGAHQLLAMRVPQHAAVDATVALAKAEIGPRVAGFVNAVLRKVAGDDLPGWLARLTAGADSRDALALAAQHPRWIVDAWADALGDPDEAELRAALGRRQSGTRQSSGRASRTRRGRRTWRRACPALAVRRLRDRRPRRGARCRGGSRRRPGRRLAARRPRTQPGGRAGWSMARPMCRPRWESCAACGARDAGRHPVGGQ